MRWIGWWLAGTAQLGCAERLIHDVDCGDGHAVEGEACFGDAREHIAVAFTPVATRVADFDGDGDEDVLVLGVDVAAGVTSAIARNDGDGALDPAIDAGMYGCSAHPALGDADGNAAVDLLVATCDSAMLVFPATSSGRFAEPAAVDVGALPRTSAIVDVDGDALPDIVALGVVGDGVVLSWARGSSMLAWSAPRIAVVGTVGHPDDPTSFSTGRLDDDDIADAVLSHASPESPPWLARGTADGFLAPAPWDELPPCTGVAVVDLDGHGDDELFVVTDGGDTLEVWRGSVGTLERIGRTDITAQRGRLLTLGDIDGDARLDLAFYAPDSDRIDLWLADRKWGWRDTDSVQIGASVDQLAIADLDGDGAAELVASTFAEGGITLVRSEP